MSLISKGAITWDSWSQHRERVKESTGVYMGILDEWLEPVADLDLPIVDYSAPLSEWDPAEFTGNFVVHNGATRHPVLDELIYQDMSGRVDLEGGHKPGVNYIIVEPRGGTRMVYRVEFSRASGAVGPEVLEVQATSPEVFLLDELPYVNEDAINAMRIYKEQTNPLLWRSSIEKDMSFAGLPVYNSNTLHIQKPGQKDTVSGALERTSEFIIALTNRNPEFPHLIVDKQEDLDDAIEVDQEFSPLSQVIAEQAKLKRIHLEIQLRLPGDSETVNRGASSVDSPRFAFVVRGD